MSSDYEQRVGQALEQDLRDLDMTINEIAPVPGALPNQTVSAHVATAAAAGQRWACVFCAFLSWAVQRDHCGATLRGDPVPWWVYPRAAFWFAVGLLGVPVLAWWLV